MNYQMHIKKVKMIRESQVIEAKNVEIAKQIFLDEVDKNFNDGSEKYDDISDEARGNSGEDSAAYILTNVENCEFIDVVDETEMFPSLPPTMFLKLASPMNYTITTEERNF